MYLGLLALNACGPKQSVEEPRSVPWEEWAIQFEVGKLDGPDSEMFGSVQDVVITSGGTLLILDGLEMTVRQVDGSGSIGEGFGRRGNGPGEFTDPVSLMVLPEDTIVVLERGPMRVHVFHWSDGIGDVVRSSKLPFWPSDGCTIGRHVFALGSLGKQTVHEIATSGEVVHSFDPPIVEDEGPSSAMLTLLNGERGGGKLACAAEDGVVIHVTELLGEMSGYRMDGRLVWSRALEGFVEPLRTIRGNGARYDFDPVEERGHRVTSATSLGGGVVQIVIEEDYPRRFQKAPIRFAVLISASTGKRLDLVVSPPEFVAVGANVAVSRTEVPVPKVFYWTRPAGK